MYMCVYFVLMMQINDLVEEDADMAESLTRELVCVTGVAHSRYVYVCVCVSVCE
jgi:hypothetical protein